MRTCLLLCLTLCAALVLGCQLASCDEINLDRPLQGVVDLTPDNFFDYVGKEKGVIVWLYTNKDARVPPMMYRIGKAFERNEEVQKHAVLAKLSFDKHNTFAKDNLKLRRAGIIYFDPSSTTYREFIGFMHPRYIARFINQVLPESKFVTPDSMSYLRELTAADVTAVIQKNEAFLYVLLYRDGCEMCERRRHVIEDVAYAFRLDEDIVVGYVNMAKEGSEQVLDRTDGRQYANQYHDMYAYRAARNATSTRLTAQMDNFFLEDIVSMINAATGNGRSTAGTYNLKYAIDKELAAQVVSIMKENDAEAKHNLVEKVRALAAEKVNTMPVLPRVRETTVNYYVQVAENIVAKGNDFATQELNRLADLIEQDQLSSKSSDKAYLRVCVLRSILTIIWDEEDEASGAKLPPVDDHDHHHSHGHEYEHAHDHGHSHGHDDDDHHHNHHHHHDEEDL